MPHTRPIALITAHGQPSAPEAPEAALALLAEQVQSQLPGWQIRSATLSTQGRFEKEMIEGAVVYPFFMARGWFVGKVLPKRLGAVPHHLACPFGLDAALPALVADTINSEIAQRGWTNQSYDLLLAAHGSARGPKAAQAAKDFATALRALLPLAQVSTGFVEQNPRVASAARSLGELALCLPFFAQSGDHSRNDIPKGLEAAGFSGHLLPVTGALPNVATLIANAIANTPRAVT